MDPLGILQGSHQPSYSAFMNTSPTYRPGQILAKIDPSRPRPAALESADQLGETDWYRVKLSAEQSVEAALDSFSAQDGVSQVVPNHQFRIESSYDSRQWGLERVGAPQAWSRAQGEGVVVAVLDTGVDAQHPDLKPNLWTNPLEIPGDGIDNDGNGYVDDVHGGNTLERTGNIADGGEHGTHVAGIVAARGDDDYGVTGVAPKATILPVRIFDNNGNTDVASVIEAFHYAESNGAKIINCSWGGAPYNQALFETMRETEALIVCSSGNRGSNNDREPHYPSGFDLPNVMAVAASTPEDQLSFISNYGATTVDIAAPGVQILSTVPGGKHKGKTGTSMAAPHVSGGAALLLQRQPELSAEELKSRLIKSASLRVPLEGKVASGLLDLAASRPQAGHGPALLEEFYNDFQKSFAEYRALDNSKADLDPRPGYLNLPDERVILGPGRMAFYSRESRNENIVFLEAERRGDWISMRQAGYEKYAGRYYEYPLNVEGSPSKPFSAPDAESSTELRFRAANSTFGRMFIG